MSSADLLSRRIGHACYLSAALIAVLLSMAAATDDTQAWVLLSALGEELVCLGLSLTVLYLADPELGVLVLASTLLSGSLNVFLKYLINAPRPPPELWRVPASGPAFPSGHAQVSSTLWSTLSIALRRRYATVLSVAVVLSVASSRVALRVHNPHDVLSGAIIGLAVGYCSARLFKRLGPGRGLLALALATSALSCWNLLLEREVEESAALVGLGLGAMASAPFLRRSVKCARAYGVATRFVALLAASVASFTTMMLVDDATPGIKVLAYFALGLVILAGPALISPKLPERRPLGSSTARSLARDPPDAAHGHATFAAPLERKPIAV